MEKRRSTRKVRLLYSDTTPYAYLLGLHDNCQSAGLCEDEAGRIFDSRLVDDLGLLNKLWNGSDITVDRKNESFRIRAPRCTVSWMVQPEVFARFMERRGDGVRGIGFLSRCLVSYPVSTQGTRFLRKPPESLDAISKFGNRVVELLNDQFDLLCPEERGGNRE